LCETERRAYDAHMFGMGFGELLVVLVIVLVVFGPGDVDDNPPPPRRHDGKVLVRKIALARVKNARLVIHPNDHPPPHFHVEVGGDFSGSAVYCSETLGRLRGELRGSLERAVRTWAAANRAYLRE